MASQAMHDPKRERYNTKGILPDSPGLYLNIGEDFRWSNSD